MRSALWSVVGCCKGEHGVTSYALDRPRCLLETKHSRNKRDFLSVPWTTPRRQEGILRDGANHRDLIWSQDLWPRLRQEGGSWSIHCCENAEWNIDPIRRHAHRENRVRLSASVHDPLLYLRNPATVGPGATTGSYDTLRPLWVQAGLRMVSLMPNAWIWTSLDLHSIWNLQYDTLPWILDLYLWSNQIRLYIKAK